MKYLTWFLILFCSPELTAQNCSSCTQTISGTSTQNISVTSSDVICIQSGAVLNGNVQMDGGQVCNEGTVDGNVVMTGGTFYNYGLLTGSANNVNHDAGTFNNYGTIDLSNYTAVGDDISVTNDGSITVNYIDLEWLLNGSQTQLINNGLIDCDYIVVDTAFLQNNDSIHLTGNLSINNGGSMDNLNALYIGGNFTMADITSSFHTTCLVQVDGNWSNNGVITGPTTHCGGFFIDGFATNQPSGQVALDNSYIDVCEQGNLNGLQNVGSIGPNVTQCTCSSPCWTVTGVVPNALSDLQAYPNPFEDLISIEYSGQQRSFHVYSIDGRLIESGQLKSGVNTINTNNWYPGIYLFSTDQFVRRIIKR